MKRFLFLLLFSIFCSFNATAQWWDWDEADDNYDWSSFYDWFEDWTGGYYSEYIDFGYGSYEAMSPEEYAHYTANNPYGNKCVGNHNHGQAGDVPVHYVYEVVYPNSDDNSCWDGTGDDCECFSIGCGEDPDPDPCEENPDDCYGDDGGGSGNNGDDDEEEEEEEDCGTFNSLVDEVLKAEGGYVNNPNDKGGPTNRGIAWNTWKQYSQQVLGQAPTLDNLKNITADDARAIYKAGFWDKSGGDLIDNPDIRHLMFDFYVNSGGNAVFVAQKLLKDYGYNLSVDGGMGPQTAGLINSVDSAKFYNDLLEARRQFFHKIAQNPGQAEHLNGWLNRLKNHFKELSDENKTNIECNE